MAAQMETGGKRRLIVVLGDQLSPEIAALRAADPQHDVVLLAEVAEEATYVRHHKKKLAFVFAAMRHFAAELRHDGWTVDYTHLDCDRNTGTLVGEIKAAIDRHDCHAVVLTEAGEWRLARAFDQLADDIDRPVEILEDDRFVCSHAAFARWMNDRKQPRMEHFYREMRRHTGLLMEVDGPVGGQWNFDKENRKPPKKGLRFPEPLTFATSETTDAVLDLVRRRFDDHFGDLHPFRYAVTRREAERAFDHFIAESLPTFGDYQDAMIDGEPFMAHAVIALYLNAGLLDPLAVCRRAERAYHDGAAPLNAVEGFIRQIIGWREYVRGIYWQHMPEYAERNFLGHQRPLPAFYWTGETDMACLRACIDQTRRHAYAHHIQRLMITGNFAMLAGVAPREVHEWYLLVYADAYEWVELPNTLGMSQYGDGGLLGSKPYAGGGNYINRMSDYCAGCAYDVKQKTGDGACPFNYLYWDFLARHRDKLGDNQRLRQMYTTWDRMDDAKKADTRQSAERFLNALK